MLVLLDNFNLTILFYVVIGVIVSTPGSHLKTNNKTQSAFSSASM